MCGRYALFSQKRFELKFKSSIDKSYNISPGQKVVVIDEEVVASVLPIVA